MRGTVQTQLDDLGKSELLQAIQEYRLKTKLVQYLKSYLSWISPRTGRIHPRIKLTGTKFTRQSSSDPNIQNVPNELARRCFGPPKGSVWYDADFDNLEMRIWAFSCGNRELIDTFNRGESVHRLIAIELFPDLASLPLPELKKHPRYKDVKTGNFAILYGADSNTADRQYGVAGAYLKISKRFPEIVDFGWKLYRQLKRDGYIRTGYGYPLRPDDSAPHKCVSAFVQGTAADITGHAMVSLDWEIQHYSNWCSDDEVNGIICQIHDEIIVEVTEELDRHFDFAGRIRYHMLEAGNRIGIPTPSDVRRIEFPKSWG